jgi:hypothetical protein
MGNSDPSAQFQLGSQVTQLIERQLLRLRGDQADRLARHNATSFTPVSVLISEPWFDPLCAHHFLFHCLAHRFATS